MPEACNFRDVAQIKKVVDIPVICAGKFNDPELADKAIANGEIDMMGMGRQLLADPETPNKFKDGREDEIRHCIGCHLGCLSRIFQPPFKDISCAINPAAGREKDYALKPAEKKKKVAVIGGGISGMEAARVSAIRGHEVHLYEKKGQLGGVFNAAAAFEFKEADKRLLTWYGKQMDAVGVKVHLNTEFKEEDAGGFDTIFVATGAHEKKLDLPGFDSPNVSYAIDMLLNKPIENKNVVVVGGGLTGCEIAYALAMKGCKVSIVEVEGTILNVEGLNAANYNFLVESLERYNVQILKNACVKKYEDGKVTVEIKTMNFPNAMGRAATVSLQGIRKEVKEIPADEVIISIGYDSDNSLYEKIKGDNVFLIGDAVSPGNVMTAIWSAYELAMNN